MSEGEVGIIDQSELGNTHNEKEAPTSIVYEDSSELEAAANILRLLQEQVTQTSQDSKNMMSPVHKELVGKSGEGVIGINLYPAGGFEVYPGDKREKYWFESTLGGENIINLSAKLLAHNEDGELVRSPRMPKLTSLVGLSLDHFASKGVSINGIKGAWGETVGIEADSVTNTNYTVFQEAIHNGKTPEEAVLETPTGRAASTYGFDLPDQLLQSPGSVSVIFRKSHPVVPKRRFSLPKKFRF